ncbi:MAG: DUF2066 domain-containing protein [Alphaproteobacteria bacterium]|nr:DUF2066 domain-containing protein [Alphaproteobacteria bacterium]
MPSLLRFFGLLVLGLFLTAPAPAADFLAVSIAVDATGQSTSQAREKALSDGQQQAFRRLLESLTISSDHARLPHPANWQDWVVDFSVDQEKTSAVRYLALLTVRFKAQPVRNLLKQAGIAFAETASKPSLVIPILVQPGRPLLWDEDNLWLKAWQERPKLSTLAPVLAPMGDNWDRQTFDVGSDKDRLEAMGRRYGAVQALVAEAKPSQNGLDIRLLYGSGATAQIAVQAQAKDQPQAVFRKGADLVALHLEEAWKKNNLLVSESSGMLLVTASFNGLNDWLRIRDRLAKVNLVRRQEILEVARNQATLALHHAGDMAQLRTALAQADLVLTQDGQGGAVLSLSSQR